MKDMGPLDMTDCVPSIITHFKVFTFPHILCLIITLKVFIHPKTLRFWALF